MLIRPIESARWMRYKMTQFQCIGKEPTMDSEKKVIETMKKAGEPLNAGKIAELSGLDRKDVDKAMKKLKTDGKIVSPKRCYWEPS
jgi:hypothetical protein